MNHFGFCINLLKPKNRNPLFQAKNRCRNCVSQNLLVTKTPIPPPPPHMEKYQLINLQQNDRILQVYNKLHIAYLHYVCINVYDMLSRTHVYFALYLFASLPHPLPLCLFLSLSLFVPPADLYLYSQTICNPSSINIHQFRVLLFMYE